MLSVVGKASTELTLSINFIGKDLIGQLGALTYMNKMGKKADKDPYNFIKYSIKDIVKSIFDIETSENIFSYIFMLNDNK